MIDIEVVQKLIEKEIHPDFTIAECYDTPLYIFINWKHKDYYADDERSQLLGPGLIVFDKNTNEYRVMGSAESWHDNLLESDSFSDPDWIRKNNIIKSFFSGNPTDDDKFWAISKIKKDIIRRNHINTDDIDLLCILIGARADPWSEEDFDMTWLPGLERRDHNLVIFDNKKAHKELMEIWNEIGFKYEIISETKLVLWKIKPAPNKGFAASVAGRKNNRQFCKA